MPPEVVALQAEAGQEFHRAAHAVERHADARCRRRVPAIRRPATTIRTIRTTRPPGSTGTAAEKHGEVFRFAKAMIAFRKAHPSIARSRFWRDDVEWFGPAGPVDFGAPQRRLSPARREPGRLRSLCHDQWRPARHRFRGAARRDGLDGRRRHGRPIAIRHRRTGIARARGRARDIASRPALSSC